MMIYLLKVKFSNKFLTTKYWRVIYDIKTMILWWMDTNRIASVTAYGLRRRFEPQKKDMELRGANIQASD